MIVDTKFQHKQTILIFWTEFAQKRHFWSNKRKVNISIEFCIFELIWVPNLSLNRKFWSFGPSLLRYFWSETSEHHHRILYIRIKIGTKFQLKQTTLFKFTPKFFHGSVTKCLLGHIRPWCHLLRLTSQVSTRLQQIIKFL